MKHNAVLLNIFEITLKIVKKLIAQWGINEFCHRKRDKIENLLLHKQDIKDTLLHCIVAF